MSALAMLCFTVRKKNGTVASDNMVILEMIDRHTLYLLCLLKVCMYKCRPSHGISHHLVNITEYRMNDYDP